MRQIFIIVPSPHPTGPIKGAYALANAISAERPVTLVTLKRGPGADAALDTRVTIRSLAGERSWYYRLAAYRKMLRDAGGRRNVGSISMCLSADIVNCLSGNDALTCASVRGNLLRNYRLDYGLPGIPVAMAHLSALRKADCIVAISSAMAAQVKLFAGKMPTIIGNFVDEAALDAYRTIGNTEGPYHIVFLATLSERKQPLLLIRAIDSLRRNGVDVVMDMIGSGPLASAVSAEVNRLGLQDRVTLHGHLPNPFGIIARADVMVLPSLSEGIARSALEALYLGVPCVLRSVDGNAELIRDPTQGLLFDLDKSLPEAIFTAAQRSRTNHRQRLSLLPSGFRQIEQARQYLALVDQPT